MSTLKWKTHADLAIRTTPTIGREEYLDFMTFQRNDRPMIMEIFGPLLGLKEEWEAQGATPEELDFSAFTYRFAGRRYLGVTTGMVGGYTPEVLEENDEVKIYRDRLGRLMKLPKTKATLALPLDYPVKTMDDWLKIKPWYEFSEERLAGASGKAAAELRVGEGGEPRDEEGDSEGGPTGGACHARHLADQRIDSCP